MHANITNFNYDHKERVCKKIIRLPLGFTVGPLEDVVAAVEVHDPVLEVELPLVPGTRDLFVLTNNDLKKRNQ